MGQLIYLASPYNHPSAQVREDRFCQVAEITALLMKLGRIVYSPIVHNHPLAVEYGLPKGWDYWQTFDETMLAKCDEIWVLKVIEGWEKSVGIKAEVDIAQRLNIPVKYVDDFDLQRFKTMLR